MFVKPKYQVLGNFSIDEYWTQMDADVMLQPGKATDGDIPQSGFRSSTGFDVES